MYKRNKFVDFIYVISLLFFVNLIAYFISSYSYLNNPSISKSVFVNRTLRTLDDSNYIYFGDLSNSYLFVDSVKYDLDFDSYVENYFIYYLEDEDEEEINVNFVVLDSNSIYNDYFNLYFYSQLTD
ncbi:MAG: hypothetical protein WCS51_02460 [Bacilli bacterium]